VTWWQTLAQNQFAGVAAFFGMIGTPLGTYLLILRARANADLKRAEADAVRAVATTDWQRGLQSRVDLLEDARRRDQATAAEWKRVAIAAKHEAEDNAQLATQQQRQIDQLIEELHQTTGGEYGQRSSSTDLGRRDRRPEPTFDRRPGPVGTGAIEQVARPQADRPRETRPGPRRDDRGAVGPAGRDQKLPGDRERAAWPGPLGGGDPPRKKP
jgi:hypothetical protein